MELNNGYMRVLLTEIGAAITAIYVPDQNGEQKNVVAGYADPKDYLVNPHYYGCTVGRYAGRIGNARFSLDGESISLTANDGPHHLHGGFSGFNKKIWEVRPLINDGKQISVTLEYFSPDGEEGYPGNLHVSVTYTLDRQNRLSIKYEATTDRCTPVNLCNHSYFNLSGFADNVLDHTLQIPAALCLEKGMDNIPTGGIIAIQETALDFREAKRIGRDIDHMGEDQGYNHAYILDDGDPGKTRLAAVLRDPNSGRKLSIYTDQPAIQVYTANEWRGAITGAQGRPYRQHDAIALETQAFPDAPNHDNFPNTLLMPGQQYSAGTIFEFSVEP